MRLGIDCQVFGASVRHGYWTYLENLLRTLRARHPEHDYLEWRCQYGPGWRLPNQLWWDQVRIPWRALSQGVDLIHLPAFSAPVVRTVPAVLTVMDVLYTRYPEWLPTRRAQWYWGRWIPFTARRATRLIVPSSATKRDLMELVGMPAERIHVIPLAISPRLTRKPFYQEIQTYRITRGFVRPYILYVGVIDRRKDLGGLARAFARIRSRLKDHQLIIAGNLIRGRTDLLKEIEDLGLQNEIVLPGYIPEPELPLLYAGASVFVYPSRWEGFGFPPLEAMAQGVPVITYRTSSLPEVVGDAAVLIEPPFETDAVAHAIVQVLEDEAYRASLVARGAGRVAEFSWDRTTDETMTVYRQCLHG
jgi:glycosyltransferase involved in cell wall biosynthesis